jgi:cytochrome c5
MHPILTIRRLVVALVCASASVMLAGCGSSPAAKPESSPQANQAKAPAGTQTANLNMDEIFPAGKGRDLVINDCTSCHTFVPIVILQMNKEEWERSLRNHRERVQSMSDADYETLSQYVIANFNPDRPVPKLPKQLLDTWTTY